MPRHFEGFFPPPKGGEKPRTYFEQRAQVMSVLERSASRDFKGWFGEG